MYFLVKCKECNVEFTSIVERNAHVRLEHPMKKSKIPAWALSQKGNCGLFTN